MKITVEQIRACADQQALSLLTDFRFEVCGPKHVILTEREIANRSFLIPNKRLARHHIGEVLFEENEVFMRTIAQMTTTLQEDGDFEFGIESDAIIIVEIIKKFLIAQKRLHAQYGTSPTQDQLLDYEYLTKVLEKAHAILVELKSRGVEVEKKEEVEGFDVGPFGGFNNIEAEDSVLAAEEEFNNPFAR